MCDFKGNLLAILLVTLLATLLATSCKSVEYIPVENVRTEYVDKVRELHDTLLVNDKETVFVNGDTVMVTRYVDRYKVVHQRDTVSIERCDTVSVPYPVERKLTWWERKKVDFGGFSLAIVVVLLAVVIWLVRKNASDK